MRVLHVITFLAAVRGGPSHSTLAAIGAHLGADDDARATLLATDYRMTASERERVRAALPAAVDLSLHPVFGRHTAAVSPALVRWMAQHVRGYDLVVVRTFMHPLMALAAHMARRARVPYVVTPHGTLSDYTFRHRLSGAKRLYYRAVGGPLVRGAAAVQCTSDTEARELTARDPAAPVRVVPHPFDVGPVPARTPVPGRVLFLSRLDPMKGLDVLLPAFARLRAARPDAHLVLAGSGVADYERGLRREAARLRIADAVSFAGFVQGAAKQALFAEASAFVLPSYRENFGIAVVEAMAAGVPVVVSPGVDIAARIAAAGAGLVAERTPEATADALARLLADADAAEAMGARGRRFVDDAFAPAAVGRQLTALYRDAAGTASSTLA